MENPISVQRKSGRKSTRVSPQVWMLFIIGLPLFIFLLILVNAYQVPNGLIMSLSALIIFGATIRKKNFGIRFTRASFLSVMICFFTVGSLVELPSLWGQQIYRHAFKSSLIQPNDSKIVELHEAFNWWIDNWNETAGGSSFDLSYYGSNLTDTSKPMEPDYYQRHHPVIDPGDLDLASFESPSIYSTLEKLQIIDTFIRGSVMIWTPDEETWGISDHTPVPHEALKDWNFNITWRENAKIDEGDPLNNRIHAHDDCDGIAVVTVSFLRRLKAQGLLSVENAYIASGKSHWFTGVHVNGTTPMVFLNHWKSVNVYCYYNDRNLPVYGQNVLETLTSTLITDEDERDQFISYLGVIAGDMPWVVPVLALLVSIVAVPLIAYPCDYDTDAERKYMEIRKRKYKKRKKVTWPFSWLVFKIGNPFSKRHLFYWLNVILSTVLLSLGVFFLHRIILLTPLYTYSTIFLYGFLFMVLFIVDRDFVTILVKFTWKKLRKEEINLYSSLLKDKVQ